MRQHTSDTTGKARRSTVIVTRPREDASPLIERLRERGHQIIAFPVLAIEPVADARALAATMACISGYRLVIFVSPNAIRRALAHRTQPWPREVTIAVMGPGSVAELAALGVGAPQVQVVAPPGAPRSQAAASRGPARASEAPGPVGDGLALQRFDSEALLATLDQKLGLDAGFDGRVLIVRGNGGRPWMADRLRERGIAVDEIESYRRVRPIPDRVAAAALRRLVGDDADAIFIVTSSEGLGNLVAMIDALLGSAGAEWLFKQTIVASHARIAEKALRMGFSKLKSAAPGDRGLVAAIE